MSADFTIDDERFRQAMVKLKNAIAEMSPPCAQCATLARLLDGVMADDHASVREAAAWLAEHQPLEDEA